jgi:demethylmenaquinone methyltransferase/2-methoxy-6-polyprenyl-1,4-benzoquinol methylase
MLAAARHDCPAAWLVQADAAALPFAAGAFDAATSHSFLYLVSDRAAVLAEVARVLRPGGRLVVLEITPGPRRPLRGPFRLYFRGLVPRLGGLIAGDPAAYTYLPDSAAAFLEPERLAEVLRGLGLGRVHIRRLALGSVAMVAGTRN